MNHLVIGCNQVEAVHSGPVHTLRQSRLSTTKVRHDRFLRQLLQLGDDQVQGVQWPLFSLDPIPEEEVYDNPSDKH